MKTKLTVLVAALALVAFTLPSLAATGSAKPAAAPSAHAAKTAVGELATIDAAAKSLSVKVKGKTDSFTLAPNATITMNGKPAQISDLKVGEKVEVTYTVQGTSMVASNVTVLGHA
ncbi:MAG TPA: hypothetical protein PK413_05320 [Thermoanaerobaculia bacterium]|nr:hypothetical protein [Thermoanaerobaculia bacterium]